MGHRDVGQIYRNVALGTEAGQVPTNADLPLRGYIDGLILTRETADRVAMSAGVCRDAADGRFIKNTVDPLAKDINLTWAAGDNAGGLNATDFGIDSDAEIDTWYHHYAIMHTDGTVDAGFDKGTAAANLLSDSGYTYYRKIGSILTDGSREVTAFQQTADEFLWAVAVQDINDAATGTSVVTHTLASVPTGFKVGAIVSIVVVQDAAAFHRVGHGDISTIATPTDLLKDFENAGSASTNRSSWSGVLTTSTSAEIKSISSVQPTSFDIMVRGWIDPRGKNA